MCLLFIPTYIYIYIPINMRVYHFTVQRLVSAGSTCCIMSMYFSAKRNNEEFRFRERLRKIMGNSAAFSHIFFEQSGWFCCCQLQKDHKNRESSALGSGSLERGGNFYLVTTCACFYSHYMNLTQECRRWLGQYCYIFTELQKTKGE